MDLREQLRIKTELLAEAEQRMSNQLDGWMSDQVEVLTAKLAAANTENTAIRNENAQLREQLQALGAHAPEEIRVLTSPDGSNFEEAICFRPTGKVSSR